MSTERERIARILTRPITQAEIHKLGSRDEVVFKQIAEAILALAESVDYLKEHLTRL
jgi:hypothetical protein